jgi:hypothetical protein
MLGFALINMLLPKSALYPLFNYFLDEIKTVVFPEPDHPIWRYIWQVIQTG